MLPGMASDFPPVAVFESWRAAVGSDIRLRYRSPCGLHASKWRVYRLVGLDESGERFVLREFDPLSGLPGATDRRVAFVTWLQPPGGAPRVRMFAEVARLSLPPYA